MLSLQSVIDGLSILLLVSFRTQMLTHTRARVPAALAPFVSDPLTLWPLCFVPLLLLAGAKSVRPLEQRSCKGHEAKLGPV